VSALARALDLRAPGRNGARLRVLQVVLTLSPGGTQRLVIDLVTRLAPVVHATVCCLDAPGEWARELAAHGVDVIPLHRPPGFRPGLGLRIARIAARRQVELIHCHHYSPFVYGRIAALLRPGVRLVFTEHGLFEAPPPSRRRVLANRLLGRLPGATFAVSADLRARMVAEGFPAARVGVIPNGIEPGAAPGEADRAEARRALGIGPGRFVVGTVARLDPVKDLPSLVHGFAALRREVAEAALVIVGDGPDRARVEDAARAAALGDAVVFTGTRTGARRLLAGFDVYANTSTREGVSLAILEAMAAALPVVATRVGGTPEVIEDGASGVLVPARAAEAVGAALLALARDPARRAALGAGARRRVEDRFTLDRMAGRYLRAYRGLPAEEAR
jgi:glycosyltransferase involved in cell wall biosynthesis